MRIILPIVLLFVAGAPLAGFAQEDNMRGVQIGVHGGLDWWDLGDIQGSTFDTENGPLFGASLGWGMSDWLGVFARYDVTFLSPELLDSYRVSHWDIGVRAVPQPFGLTVRPYAELSGAIRYVKLTGESDFEINGSGVGLGVGAGLYVFLSPKIAVNAGLAGTLGNLDQVTIAGVSVSDDVSAKSVRLLAGITVIP